VTSWSVVIPTLGRPSLQALLKTLAAQRFQPREVVVVDDRGGRQDRLDVDLVPGARVLDGGGRGPAHARNVGWRAVDCDWVVFVDDDVLLPPDWSVRLVDDLERLTPGVAGSQARLRVPLPAGRRPTDWERSTAGLEGASWITAEMAYRRTVLAEVEGFDERFPRAFREDADLAWRVRQRGHVLVKGAREVVHPVRPGSTWASLHQQRGNADDALMRRLHGPRWRHDTLCPPGRFSGHVATVASGSAAVAAGLAGRRGLAAVASVGWLALTAEFAWRRIAPGPRTAAEVRRMLLTSLAIPFAAVWHRAAGQWQHRGARPWTSRPRAVLFDRDGTLIEDVPYNGDPAAVRPVDGALRAVQRLRDNGIAVGVVTNQSGVGRGLLRREQVDAVNARVDELLGPFATWQVCPHAPADHCACRKPAPGLVLAAARELGVRPHEVVVVGDIGSDVQAAQRAGSAAVLVPTPVTLPEEVVAAPRRARTLTEAVDLLLGGRS
jgi:histidinol-phosphate phosphatase family protein